MSLRRRVGLELATLASLTALYLLLMPVRPVWLDAGLALGALALVAGTARDTRERVWGPPPTPRLDRPRDAAARPMLVGTVVVTLLFVAGGWLAGPARPAVTPTMLAALVLFVPWAWLQQTLLQFYLLGRLRALLPDAPPPALAALNGLVFGAVHLPDLAVTVPTIIGGAVWSWYYLRDRCLGPVVLSHAVLGTTYYYWVRGEDLVLQWLSGSG